MVIKTKKAVGYVRVSTAIQAKEGESLSTQRQQIADFAKQKGWQLECIYADEGISGTTIEHRIDFKKLIVDAKKGKFEVVIFTKLSRFARNAREYLNLSHELEKHGISLVSIKENIDPTTSTGKMIAGILALFAEWEHETIKEQMYENKMARWRQQRIFNGRPPYAYYWNKEKKQLEINENEAETYKLIVNMYLDQCMSFRDICIKLRNKGIICKKAYWSSTTVSYTFKNPVYYGNCVVNQYEYGDGARGAGSKRTKKMKPDSEHIVFKIPPLISKSRWDQIQKRTEFNKRKSKNSERTKDFYLRDVLVCGRCGGRVKPKVGNIRKNGTAPRYYTCYWASTSEKNIKVAGRKKKCSLPFIKAKTIESTIWSHIVMKLHFNPETAFKDLFNSEKSKIKMDELKQTINTLEVELRKKKIAQNNLFKLLEDEDVNIKDVKQRLQDNSSVITELDNNIKEANLQYQELEAIKDREEEISDFLHNNKSKFNQLRKDIANLDKSDRKILIESMLEDNIIVDYQDDNDVDGPGGPTSDFKLTWNHDILQRFVDEGKIAKLDKNSAGETAKPDFGAYKPANHSTQNSNYGSYNKTARVFSRHYKFS